MGWRMRGAFPRSFRQITVALTAIGALCGLLLASAGCSRREPDVVLGRTSAQDLEEAVGKPEAVVPMATRPQALSYRYARGESYQVEGGRVVARLRPPETHEETLQFWMHSWRSVETHYEEVAGSRDRHGHARFQLRAPALRRAIVYDPQGDRVTQVVDYAAP